MFCHFLFGIESPSVDLLQQLIAFTDKNRADQVIFDLVVVGGTGGMLNPHIVGYAYICAEFQGFISLCVRVFNPNNWVLNTFWEKPGGVCGA